MLTKTCLTVTMKTFAIIVVFLASSTAGIFLPPNGALFLNCTPDSFGDSFDPPVEELVALCETNGHSVDYLGIDIIRDGRVFNLASYNSTRDVTVNGGPNVTAEVVGPNNDLRVVIAFPGPEDASTYACRGKPSFSGTTLRTVHTKVIYLPPPIPEIIFRIEDHEERIDNLTQTLDERPPFEPQLNFTDDIEDLRACKLELEISLNATIDRLDEVELDLDLLECKENLTHNLVDSIDGALFEYSEPFDGKEYILSYFTVASFVTAQEFCESRNGTLAEIATGGELTNIRNFLLPLISYTQTVLIGGSRQMDGSFINPVGGDAAFTDFFSSVDPAQSYCEDCLALAFNLFGEEGIHHVDVPCDFLPLYPKWERDHAFLCEIPQRVPKDEACQVEPDNVD